MLGRHWGHSKHGPALKMNHFWISMKGPLTTCCSLHPFLFLSEHIARLHFPGFPVVRGSYVTWLSSGQWNVGRSEVRHFQTWRIKPPTKSMCFLSAIIHGPMAEDPLEGHNTLRDSGSIRGERAKVPEWLYGTERSYLPTTYSHWSVMWVEILIVLSHWDWGLFVKIASLYDQYSVMRLSY